MKPIAGRSRRTKSFTSARARASSARTRIQGAGCGRASSVSKWNRGPITASSTRKAMRRRRPAPDGYDARGFASKRRKCPRRCRGMGMLAGAPRHDQASDEHLHRLATLVESGGAHLDDALRGARLRFAHFEDLAFHAQHIARPHGLGPAELLEARPDDPAR